MKTTVLIVAAALALTAASPTWANGRPGQAPATFVQPSANNNELQENLHKGKRCQFTKLEAIITAVGWFFGVIPGAILTPLSCKMDLFRS